MATIKYTVGELKRIVRESKNEFEPVLGKGVMADNERNEKSYLGDAKKRAKGYDGGLNEPAKKTYPERKDGNRTPLDFTPRTKPDKKYTARVNAELEGFDTQLQKQNGIEKVGEFNDGIGKDIKKSADERKKVIDALGHSGLNSRELEKKGVEGDKDAKLKNSLYEGAPKAKRLTFKHTKFINESQMLARIPEEYKVDGQKIFMRDSAGNEYTVVCERSEKTGIVETNVVGYNNPIILNEQMKRINELFGYKTEEAFSKQAPNNRVNEDKVFSNMMNNVRELTD